MTRKRKQVFDLRNRLRRYSFRSRKGSTEVPQTIHEKAALFTRLLSTEQIFVDGQKRTALYTTTLFYVLNGYEFDYDEAVYDLLQRLATDESTVDNDELIEYVRTHTTNT